MQIRRVILKGVRNFVDLDRSFEDSWSGNVPDSLLLIGPNGSGKTTLLNVVADLWQVFANCFREDGQFPLAELPLMGDTLAHSDLAAIEIVGLEREPIWIFVSARQLSQDLVAQQVNSHRVGVLRSTAIRGGSLEGGLRSEEDQEIMYTSPGVAGRGAAGKSSEWQRLLALRLVENIFGKHQDLPNIVYLESETRVMLSLSEKFSVQRESEEFRWLARYEPTASRKGSLQNYLYNLKVVDESAFQQIVQEANKFLIGKRLDGFDKPTGDLMVETDGGERHPITDLSSGEKQVLLMLATITRWLRPGGIVLIDEPDLHLHSSLTTAFVGHLRRMVMAKNGQLIIASHAPELLQDFTTSHRVELGSLSGVSR